MINFQFIKLSVFFFMNYVDLGHALSNSQANYYKNFAFVQQRYTIKSSYIAIKDTHRDLRGIRTPFQEESFR